MNVSILTWQDTDVNVLETDTVAPVWIDRVDVTVGGPMIVLTLLTPIAGPENFSQVPVFRCAISRESLVRMMETCGKALVASQPQPVPAAKN